MGKNFHSFSKSIYQTCQIYQVCIDICILLQLSKLRISVSELYNIKKNTLFVWHSGRYINKDNKISHVWIQFELNNRFFKFRIQESNWKFHSLWSIKCGILSFASVCLQVTLCLSKWFHENFWGCLSTE